jgi:hypothetical protein
MLQAKPKEKSHPLKGTMARRIKLFTRLSPAKKITPEEPSSDYQNLEQVVFARLSPTKKKTTPDEPSDYENLEV